MYAILRTAKLNAWSKVSASASHTYRTRPTPNADPARADLNKTLVGTHGDVLGDVKARVGAVTAKPRKNAVLAVEVLLTASPAFFEGKSGKEVAAWAHANVAWLKQRFGAANVSHVALHRDESTPHLVAYVVPEREGRLNCRAILGSPELLSDLQTDYAAAMGRFGLQRGLKGSRATHQTVKDFYGRLDAVAGDAHALMASLGQLEEPPPPQTVVQRLWEGEEAQTARVKGWKGREKGKRRALVQKAARAAVEASTASEAVRALRAENARLAASVEALRGRLDVAETAAALSKDETARLRRLDVSAVAARLGHMGEVRRGENAIDLVRRAAGFDYRQALAWLAHEFGPTAAAVVARQDVKELPRPFTPAENAIRHALSRQMDALGCDRFRVSVVPEKGGAPPFLPGKGRDGERFFDRDGVRQMVPWLRQQNAAGKHIYLTPMDDSAYYILLDDVKTDMRTLEGQGFQPCLVQSSSWDKLQAVFKVPREGVDRDAVLHVFNALNAQHGDPGMAGLRHPFRAAGFQNRKSKYAKDGKFPFVQVIQGINRYCERCTAMVKQVMAAVKASKDRANTREEEPQYSLPTLR